MDTCLYKHTPFSLSRQLKYQYTKFYPVISRTIKLEWMLSFSADGASLTLHTCTIGTEKFVGISPLAENNMMWLSLTFKVYFPTKEYFFAEGLSITITINSSTEYQI